MEEADAFAAKAAESLASAEDDFAQGRHNSCARNSYYAAFQAAVAALLREGIRPRGQWSHSFVQARFAGVLIARRRSYGSAMRDVLPRLLEVRNTADYSAIAISASVSRRVLQRARELVRQVEEQAYGHR